MGGAIVANAHNILGMISLIATFFIVAGGFFARFLNGKLLWKSIFLYRVTEIHKVSGSP
jgi:hypothetical protein